MNPTTVQELITLLTQVVIEYGEDTPLEFQDYDEYERNVDIVLENKISYTNSSETTKKLAIRIV